MDEVAIDINNGRLPWRFLHQMGVPDFVVERFSGHFPCTIAVWPGL
jgi:hypothetical protein